MKRNWKPFISLKKREKALRCVNLVLMLGFFFASLTIMILQMTKGNYGRLFMSSIVMEVLFILPLLLEALFGKRISNIITFCYTIYVVLAGFVGSLLSVYYTFSGYDKIVHVLFGYIFSMPAIFLISLCQDYKNFKPITVALFCLLFSLSLELLWEILEYGIDRLLGQTMQGAPIEGYGVPLVTDTITDMICNTSGALIFFIQYLVGKKTKINLGIKQIEQELVFVKKENVQQTTIQETKNETAEKIEQDVDIEDKKRIE